MRARRRRVGARGAALAAAASLVLGAATWSHAAGRGERTAVDGRAAPSARAAATPPATIERRLAAMGTELTVAVEAADRAVALAASERAVTAVETAEARLSTWRDDSELARFDRAPPGVPQPLSPRLAAELRAALVCARATNGAFDPTVGPLVAAWGLRRGGRSPSADELAAARAATGYQLLTLGESSAVRAAGTVIEEGGFGKGAALAAAIEALAAGAEAETARLDFGGQVAWWRRGGDGDGGGGRVRLADPGGRGRPVLALSLPGGSLATSGNSERGIVVDGVGRGHLLDPRSGRPAADFGSLTVWVAGPWRGVAAALAADCLSTGLFVLGPDAALAWAAAEPGVEVVVVERREAGLRARASVGLAGRLRPLAGDVALQIVRGEPAAPGRAGEKTRAAVTRLVRSGPAALLNPAASGANTPAVARPEKEYR